MNKGRVNTTGLLYRQYLLKRTALRKKAKLLKIVTNPATTSAPESVTFDLNNLTLDLDEDCNESTIDKIKNTWTQSYAYRQLKYADKGLELINKLKVLKSSLCPDLVAIDFKSKYDLEDKLKDSLERKWPDLSKSIIEHAINRCGFKKDELDSLRRRFESPSVPQGTEVGSTVFVNLNYSNLQEVFRNNDLLLHDNSTQCALSCLILPSLLKHSFRGNENSGKWKPKPSDMQLSFMRHIEEHEQLDDLTQSVQQMYDSLEVKSPQPYIVCCGPLDRIQCCHVIVEKLRYTFKDVLKAVDFLYKAFLVLGIAYPCGSAHVWTFFQRHVYNMDMARKCVAKRKSDELDTELRKITEKRIKA